MRIKGFISLIALCWTTIGMTAQHLTGQEAMERAIQYLSRSDAGPRTGSHYAPGRNLRLEAVKIEAHEIYAFNIDGG